MSIKNLLFALILLLTVIVLSITLFFPISHDLSIFMLGGKAILEGKKLYVDFFDLKPPLIYYLFAFIEFIFGFDEFKVRIFDFIYQLFTVYSIVFVLNKTINSRNLAMFGGLVYASIYANLNYFGTFQIEGLIGLPLVWIIYLLFFNDKSKNKKLILTGILNGLIVSLNLTFAIITLPIILIILLENDILVKIRIKRTIILVFFVCLTVLFASFLLAFNKSWLDYLNLLNHIFTFNSLLIYSNVSFDKIILSLNTFFGDNFSLLLLGMAGFSIPVFLKDKSFSSISSKIINFVILLIVFLLFSIIIDKSYNIHNYSRMFIPLILISILGFNNFITYFNNGSSFILNYKKYLIIFAMPIVLLFSPLPRTIKLFQYPAFYFFNQEKFYELYYRNETQTNRKLTFSKLADFINADNKFNEKVISIPLYSSEIYFRLNSQVKIKFLNSLIFYNLNNNNKIKKLFYDELTNANYLIFSNNDKEINFNSLGVNINSFDIMKAIPMLDSIISLKFQKAFQFKDYIVLKKITKMSY
jgi:hypothetical protein